jgi:hypothetical protein
MHKRVHMHRSCKLSSKIMQFSSNDIESFATLQICRLGWLVTPQTRILRSQKTAQMGLCDPTLVALPRVCVGVTMVAIFVLVVIFESSWKFSWDA